MKRLTCEVCGSTDLMKQEGVFVCQACGCKYSVEEVKKLMVEGTVEVTGSVQIDKSSEMENLLIIARRARIEGNYDRAANHYDEVLKNDPDNWEANFYRTYCMTLAGRIMDIHNNVSKTINAANSTFYMLSQDPDNDSAFAEIIERMQELTSIALENYYDIYGDSPEWLERDIINGGSYFHNSGTYTSMQEDCKEIVREMCKFYSQVKDVIELNSAKCLCLTTALESMKKDLLSIPQAPFKNQLPQSYEMYDRPNRDLRAYVDNMISTSRKIYDLQVEIERKAKETEEKVRREAYWDQHKEEKDRLEAKKESLNNELQTIQEKMQPFEEEIDRLKQKKQDDVPSQKEKEAIESKIRNLLNEKKQMGLFKRKEKEMIQQQIDSLQAQIGPIKEKIANEKQELSTQIDEEIQQILESMAPLESERQAALNEIKSIDDELTRSR